VSTEAEVFVIESLDPDDEGNGRFEGAIISRILSLHGKTCKYRYVRTRKEFKRAVTQFGKSPVPLSTHLVSCRYDRNLHDQSGRH